MSSLFVRRLLLSLLLAAFVFYAAKLAPPDSGHEPSFLDLAMGRGAARNSAVFAVFNLLGVIPLMYWALMIPDGRGQRVWAWPFALGMMAFGGFALLPYLIVRRPNPMPAPGGPNALVRWFGGRPFGVFVAISLAALAVYGLALGDGLDYLRLFRTSNFVHVMTLDFVLLSLLFPLLLTDDFARRGLSDDAPLARFARAVPLLGPAVYLAARPSERTGVEAEPGTMPPKRQRRKS